MSEQDYLFKMEALDLETKNRFDKMFNNIYTNFTKLSYSKAELFLKHLEVIIKKDSIVTAQLWEIEPKV